jgi:ABC-type branched-subunit amino acid transport system substrate-binding protein
MLAENDVPAVGFFTGAGLLRPGVGDILNYRASYVQETAKVIEAALKAGVSSNEICAYVQNDAYGMAGVTGIMQALAKQPDVDQITATLDNIIAMEGADPERNNLGPVGVYTRNTLTSKDGYESLKNWEAVSGHPCRLVVSVGTYIPIARFAAYSRFKGENWVISAVSFTGADNFATELKKLSVTDKVVMTQVVPPLDSPLPIVQEARNALGDEINYVSMEGYIATKMFLTIMRNIAGPITRQSFEALLHTRLLQLPQFLAKPRVVDLLHSRDP